MVKQKVKQRCYYKKVKIVVSFVGRKELMIGKWQKGGSWDAGDALFLDLGGSLYLLYDKILKCTFLSCAVLCI